MRQQKLPQFWLFLIVIIFVLGLFFRVVNLEPKIYWVDEVATSLRIFGYTKQEVIQEISELDIISIKDLQKYQKLNPEKDFNDTLSALSKSPEHTPLYFLMLRFWVRLFGDSVATIRSLSVVVSILALPCIYWLCLELFKSPLAGQISLALLAISPFYIAYAQEARPYSLWTVTILLSSVTFLRAIRLNTCYSWGFYSFTLIISLYTSLLSFLVVIAQSIYIFVVEKFRFTKTVKNYLIAFSLSIIAFIPWLLVIFYNWQRLQENTAWTRVPMQIPAMFATWLYSIPIIFIESPIYKAFDPIIVTRVVIDLNLFALVGFSFYFLCRASFPKVRLYILTLILVPNLILILIDLAIKWQISTAPRYMITLQLGIVLTLAYLLAHKISDYSASFRQQQIWTIIFLTIISISVGSNILNVDKSPRYQKTRNLHNLPIAAIVNQAKAPILIADPKDTLDLISLSYSLKENVKIQLFNHLNLAQFSTKCREILIFNPSLALRQRIEQEKQLKLEQVYQPKLLITDEIHLSLWQIKSLKNNCSYQQKF